jgi:hypothetical protein
VFEIDYGFQMLPGIVLRIADTEKWLLQPELKAIYRKLTYGEKEETCSNGRKFKYRGYLNAEGKRQGVGIITFYDGEKIIGEWNDGCRHGAVKKVWPDGFC